MPLAEIQDFDRYWRQSMQDEDGNPRPEGGPESSHEGVAGVEYNKFLIPWCKGNSPSYDKTTMRISKWVLNKLVDRLRLMLRAQDMGKKSSMRSAGITSSDIESSMGKPVMSGKNLGKFNPKWIAVEEVLLKLLEYNHIQIFSTLEQRSLDEEARVKDYLENRGAEPLDMSAGICQFLTIKKTQDKGGHVRLSRRFGWEAFVRDYFGAPHGVPGYVTGSLDQDVPKDLVPTMPIPLHLCLAETIANVTGNSRGVWGKGRIKVRREIVEGARPNSAGLVDRISLDQYYRIYAENNVLHMAETDLRSSNSNNASAEYELVEVNGSNPKSWDVLIDPYLIRWRELQREREVTRSLDEEDDEDGDSQ